MSSFLQTSDGDIDVTNGRTAIVSGALEKAQKIRNRLRFFLGEWFLDLRLGVPYYGVVLVKNPDLEIVKRLYRHVIESVPGIVDVVELDVLFDSAARTLSYTFRAIDDEGTPITGDNSESPFIVGIE